MNHRSFVWLFATLASFLLAGAELFAQAGAGTGGPSPGRMLAPGVLTTITPEPLEAETFTKPIPLVELQANLQGLDWTPNYLPKSEVLAEKAKTVVLRRTIWNLEFSFKPLRRLYVDIPQPTGKMQRKQIWYMVYRVRNAGSEMRPKENVDETYKHTTYSTERVNIDALRFLPQFVLNGHVLEGDKYVTKEYLDRIIPAAIPAIQQREFGGRELLNTVKIQRMAIPLSDDQNDRSVWGVVTWEDLDPRIDFFSIYIGGLTNAYRFADPAGAYAKGDPPGKGRVFQYKTLRLNFHRAGDALHEHEEELHYGVRLDADPNEQDRILTIYGLKSPLDHLWVYR